MITTIQDPTGSILQLTYWLNKNSAQLIVIGDQKGPLEYKVEGTVFLSLADQLRSGFELAQALPAGHYTRKNVGYLIAIKQGATCIYETDDDNAPQYGWVQRQETVKATKVEDIGWINVYCFFTNKRIWPRGFPLDKLTDSFSVSQELSSSAIEVKAPIQQGLVNGSPDVDAIWRLVLDEPFEFNTGPSIYLPHGCWCPFNSQSTWWFPVAYPLMYLPSYCSFRMTDIWRSFIAQRCLWEIDSGIVFHGPEVVQERNAHNLMKDFADEIPGYTRNREMAEILENLPLVKGENAIGDNLLACYEALIKAGFFEARELNLVATWLDEIEKTDCAAH